jgi:hypothetical protein
MQVGADGYFHLTYCTNIHPGEGWDEVYQQLQTYPTALKARLSPQEPFGIGLRLSGRDSSELLEGNRLAEFQEFLRREGLYVFTLNGFPYGPFHGVPVKADVHAPDWRDEERVQYTLRLVTILAALLPDGLDGGISTSPLSYKTWVDLADEGVWRTFVGNLVRVAEALARVRTERGALIHLDLEPEPDGVLGNSDELIEFYSRWLLPVGAGMLAERQGIAPEEARSRLLDHIRICLDTCHMSVSFEAPRRTLQRLDEAGINVGKLQISAALKVPLPANPAERRPLGPALEQFADPVYLHQVGQRNGDGSIRQYPDLDDALPHLDDPAARQWNVHFHVPIFVERYGTFASTQDDIREVLALLRERRFTRHVEIETYTWGVLPPDLKRDLRDSIQREYEWVLDAFN